MNTFRTIESRRATDAPMDNEDFLEALHEIGSTLDYVSRAARDRAPVSSEYIGEAQALCRRAEHHGATLVDRGILKNAVWFGLGVIVAGIVHAGLAISAMGGL